MNLVNPREAQIADKKDFDLVVRSHKKDGHLHTMERPGLDLDDGTSSTDQKQGNPNESSRWSINRWIEYLVHACQCQDANCTLPGCQKMKSVVQRKSCERKNGNCPICKQLLALCGYHAEHCHETECLVPFCPSMKHKLRQQQQMLKTYGSQSVPSQPSLLGPGVAQMHQQNTMIGSVPPDQGSLGMGAPLSQRGPELNPTVPCSTQ